MSTPLIRPTATPAASAAAIPSLGSVAAMSARVAPDRPRIDPADRSTPRLRITSVIPTATMHNTLAPRSTFMMLRRSRK
jgi:hypothetical protein